jgi:PAS domain S-box-containing protein
LLKLPKPVNHLFLRRGELISILIALVMLLAIGIFSSVDWYEYRQNRDEVFASRLIFEHTSTLLLYITDAETSQRGFLLSGDPAYLQLYEGALRSIPRELDILDSATGRDDYLHGRVRRLRALTMARLDEASQTVELRKQSRPEASMAIIRTGKGKALMDSIRQVAGEIHTRENGIINGRSNIVRAHSDRSHFVAISSSAVLLVLLGLGAVTISRATERREQLIADLDRERNQTAEVRDLLQTTLSSIGDAVLVTDRRGTITFLNRIAESLTGWRAEEAQGKPAEEVFHIVHEDTRERADSPVGHVLAEGKVVDFKINALLLGKDGSEIPVDDSGAPIRTGTGEILGVVLVFRDVTSRRAAERERERLLAEAERSRADAEQQRSHLHSLFLQAPAMINIHRGPTHIFELVHPLTTELLGGRDVTGRAAREVVPEHEYVRLLDEVFESGRPAAIHQMQMRSSAPDGSSNGDSPGRDVFLNCVFCPWREPEGAVAGVMTLAIDITEQVRSRQAMEATQERLRETAKLESLGVLAGGIAHDFNNLLVGILGNASLALDTLPHSAPSRGMIENAIRASEKAAALTRQMLAYSGKGRFVLTRVNFSALVEEMLPLIRSSMPGAVVIRTELAEGLPPVEGDSSQLQQVFMNLAINAAEACDAESGMVTIVTAPRQVDERYNPSAFGLPALQPGLYVSLEVTDNGCGMDEATVARIFDPFFTTKFTGRGLGLSAVLGIIRAHKGAIRVDSAAGRGSAFRVLFPAAPREAKRPPADIPKAHGAGGTGTILVVDDEAMVRNMARATLEHYGYRVVEAENGETAVGIFREGSGAIDAVILDLTMPAMSGEATLNHLKRIDPAVPVVLSSGFSEAEATRRFHGEDLAGFLQKPYTAVALAERVKLVLSGGKNGSA